jgi:hypothetical protein
MISTRCDRETIEDKRRTDAGGYSSMALKTAEILGCRGAGLTPGTHASHSAENALHPIAADAPTKRPVLSPDHRASRRCACQHIQATRARHDHIEVGRQVYKGVANAHGGIRLRAKVADKSVIWHECRKSLRHLYLRAPRPIPFQ